jgi:adenylate cyclase
LRILKIAVWIAVAINAGFGALGVFANPWLGVVNLLAVVVFLAIPKLYHYGELVAPLTFLGASYLFIFVTCWMVGTDSGSQFFFLAAASIAVLILGVEHIVLAATVAGVGAGLTIAFEFLAPADTGAQPAWVLRASFVSVIVSASFLVVATIWYALREINRAEEAMEAEYERSESLLTNILPTSIAERLKNPSVGIIADSYDDASILFADIGDFTKRASQAVPGELVEFLNKLYTDLDRLVDQRGLEKVKTSGDSYMVVSGVPDPRPDHLGTLARLALDIADTVAGLRDPLGQPVSLRIGLAAGPVVAGVVGARRFFYDVWGDAVNLASRMESTDREDRIQVPQDVYERLASDFVFEERGDVEVKGKGIVHTWYLVSERAVGDSVSRQLFALRPHRPRPAHSSS